MIICKLFFKSYKMIYYFYCIQMEIQETSNSNFAHTIGQNSRTKYIIQDNNSMLLSCDCSCAMKVNMLKHQCKVLMCKAHQEVFIIQ